MAIFLFSFYLFTLSLTFEFEAHVFCPDSPLGVGGLGSAYFVYIAVGLHNQVVNVIPTGLLCVVKKTPA